MFERKDPTPESKAGRREQPVRHPVHGDDRKEPLRPKPFDKILPTGHAPEDAGVRH